MTRLLDKFFNSKLIKAILVYGVLIILFYKHNNIHVLLTQRTHNVKTHKGQISFPGGLYKKTDKLMINTALRETSEEDIVKNIKNKYKNQQVKKITSLA